MHLTKSIRVCHLTDLNLKDDYKIPFCFFRLSGPVCSSGKQRFCDQSATRDLTVSRHWEHAQCTGLFSFHIISDQIEFSYKTFRELPLYVRDKRNQLLPSYNHSLTIKPCNHANEYTVTNHQTLLLIVSKVDQNRHSKISSKRKLCVCVCVCVSMRAYVRE